MVVKQDYKAALKCYDKVLKKHPEDYTAIRNALLAARKMKNLKLEKKYLQMVVKYGPENEQKQAQTRLNMM
jgi:tetratricopeptide (TPR) repeat protein